MSVAIDIGTNRLRMAAYDRAQRRSYVVADIPSAAHVSQTGTILVGSAAVVANERDPRGAIDDLKARVGGSSFFRQRQLCSPLELFVYLLSEARRLAGERPEFNESMTDCVLTVPCQLGLQQREWLTAVARRAGFARVALVDEPLAAGTHWLRQQPFAGHAIVVCDLGQRVKLSVLRRRGNDPWRADLELLLPCSIPCSGPHLPPQLFDQLRGVATDLTQLGLEDAPLLIVGGRANTPGNVEACRTECWKSEIYISPDAESAIVLGAVEFPTQGAMSTVSQPDTSSFVPLSEQTAAPTSSTSANWISADGMLSLSDYHLSEIEQILSACEKKIREGQLIKLQLFGEDWLDQHVRALVNRLQPERHAFGDRAKSVLEYSTARHPGLAVLEISVASRLSAAAIQDLASLATLKRINLSRWRVREISVDGIRHFARLPMLESIELPLGLDRLLSLQGQSRREALRQFLRERLPKCTIV